jgi:hypothetical protein
VEREFRRYLECGILADGFARARCPDCGHDCLVAFSVLAGAACVGLATPGACSSMSSRSSTGCLEPNGTVPLRCRSPHWS